MLKTLRTVLIGVFVLGGVVSVGWGWHWFHRPGAFPIRAVRVVGNYQFVDPDTLEKVVFPYVSNGFFNVNIRSAESALSGLPGVAVSSLRRVWPDRIEIRITEKQAEATLPDGSVYATDGSIFRPIVAKDLSQLPVFAGAAEDLPEIKNVYDAAEFVFLPLGFHVNFVGCDALGSWTIGVIHAPDAQGQRATMMIIVGQDQVMEKTRRFAEHFSMLEQTNGNRIPSSVDLRYTLGFSASYPKKVT